MRALLVEATEELRNQQTYYEILEVQPDASPQEIRDSYLRIKSAYSKDSIALYTLMNASETQEILRRIEEAYLVLSHQERRKEYDRLHGIVEIVDGTGSGSQTTRKVVSIDRVPPMEGPRPGRDANDLLRAPITDFSSHTPSSQTPNAASPAPSFTGDSWSTSSRSEAPGRSSGQPPTQIQTGPDLQLLKELESETEWQGTLLKKIREARNLSLEEVSETTRISRTYLAAIEEENFQKLPAAVYVRGFLTQVARALKIPPEPIVAAYLKRYHAARPD
jgi:curved DNA-binding protein CbpA